MEKKTATKKQSKPKAVVAAPEKKRTVAKVKKAAHEAPAVITGLHNLQVPFGSHKKRKLLGRGSGSGHGKTSTRGSKGQTSRAGRHFYAGFEGGTSPLIRRSPKRGFNSKFKKVYQIVNLNDLSRIKETNINPELLEAKGLIADKEMPVKILGDGEIKNSIIIRAHAFSKGSLEKIQKAGGKAEVVTVEMSNDKVQNSK